MIPANAFTPTPVVSGFVSPFDRPYSATQQVVPGGHTLNDPTGGRDTHLWVVYYDGSQIHVRLETETVPVFSMLAADVYSLSLAFDTNMAPTIAWQTVGGAKLYFYDPVSSTFKTLDFPGVTSCRLCVDDTRDFYAAQSDIIFSYTLDGSLYWRQQRDRYTVERLIGATAKRLKRAGKNKGGRLQFELV